MAIDLTGMLKPKGDFPIAEAEDIEMTDGTRLSEQTLLKPVKEIPEDAEEHPNIFHIVVEDLDSTTGNGELYGD